jgi:hypothetical protein
MGESTAALRLSVNFDGPMPALLPERCNSTAQATSSITSSPWSAVASTALNNLQFQTVADAKAKDRTESLCRK